MFEIENNTIKITKGDSAALKVDLFNYDGTEYTMQPGDKLTMTVRKKPTSEVLLQVESNSNIIVLDPLDTKNLEPRSCCFDIQLDTSGNVYTVVGLDDSNIKNMVVFDDVTE